MCAFTIQSHANGPNGSTTANVDDAIETKNIVHETCSTTFAIYLIKIIVKQWTNII